MFIVVQCMCLPYKNRLLVCVKKYIIWFKPKYSQNKKKILCLEPFIILVYTNKFVVVRDKKLSPLDPLIIIIHEEKKNRSDETHTRHH